MKRFASVGVAVLAGSLGVLAAGCCCGGGAGRHSDGGERVIRERVVERDSGGAPSITRQLQDLDDALRRRLISREEYEAARLRIIGGGGVSGR